MRGIGLAALLLATACEQVQVPPVAPRPQRTEAPLDGSSQAAPTITGTYRLSRSGRAKVTRWARVLHRPKAVPYVETIHLRPGAKSLLVELGPARKGPYALRPRGNDVWSYPLSRSWTVTVAYKPRRDVVKVHVGPVTVTYHRVPPTDPAVRATRRK